jgi:YVTN family beta-propeller protein
VDPTGKFAYVTNFGSNDVSMYTINATTGALTSIGTIAAGSTPTSIAIHPSGRFAYVTNSGSNDVSMYSIDSASGALTLMGTIGT